MGLGSILDNKGALVTPIIISSLVISYFYVNFKNKITKLQKKLEEERNEKQSEIKKCKEQRLGRTRAERELRRVVNELKEDRENKNTERPPDYPPIGFLESCFRERNGTPRQGLIVTKGKARLKLKTSVNPTQSLEGLEQYSHCWLIFVFHENTNTLRSVRKDRPSTGVKAKVAPPRLDGIKVGLFSTRTPHRPNAIGLSVAKIDKVVGDTVYLSGIDLIDGTPILDIKPYSVHDTVINPINPQWVTVPVAKRLLDVIILDSAKEELLALVNTGRMKFYDNYPDIEQCIKEVLIEDIRSVRKRKSDKNRSNNNNNNNNSDDEDNEQQQQQSKESGPEKHRFSIDILNVRFTVENEIATVFKVEEDDVLTGKEENIYMVSNIYKSENQQKGDNEEEEEQQQQQEQQSQQNE
ncbi:hypothetical protein DLAC_00142 [Tieghemostelium lacteum]|uniref:TsaA-like domain-containing protein n=1 Tax=Tieghemostelium lacteum TaxID=361077 RepID=A0A152A8Y5_TIELA|nr:hypothetical protein DLAC_00142 [Tieghemostelium lacteum]|eukprot:KYR02683.1 hypothetical protein DLAC_00142 [Tieghemostelium lacteum]